MLLELLLGLEIVEGVMLVWLLLETEVLLYGNSLARYHLGLRTSHSCHLLRRNFALDASVMLIDEVLKHKVVGV